MMISLNDCLIPLLLNTLDLFYRSPELSRAPGSL